MERARPAPVGAHVAPPLPMVARAGGRQHVRAALGRPALLHEGGRVPAPRSGPPPRRRSGPTGPRDRATRRRLARRRRPGPGRRRGRVASADVADARVDRAIALRGPAGAAQLDVRALEPSGPDDADGHRRLRGQVRHQDGGRHGLAGPSDPLGRPDRAPRAAAPRRRPGAHGLAPRRRAGSSPICACGPTPTPSATAGSSPPRACASRPRSRRCARPGPTTSGAATPTTTSTTTASGARRSGLRQPEADDLAERLLEAAPRVPRIVPRSFPDRPQRHDQGERLRRKFSMGTHLGNPLRNSLRNPLWRDGGHDTITTFHQTGPLPRARAAGGVAAAPAVSSPLRLGRDDWLGLLARAPPSASQALESPGPPASQAAALSAPAALLEPELASMWRRLVRLGVRPDEAEAVTCLGGLGGGLGPTPPTAPVLAASWSRRSGTRFARRPGVRRRRARVGPARRGLRRGRLRSRPARALARAARRRRGRRGADAPPGGDRGREPDGRAPSAPRWPRLLGRPYDAVRMERCRAEKALAALRPLLRLEVES